MALTVGGLAGEAIFTAQTASAHLAMPRQAKLVTIEAQGRHRYFRPAGPDVAGALCVKMHDAFVDRRDIGRLEPLAARPHAHDRRAHRR
jgi:DNA-binding transcriptional ArsR family regulator